MYPAALAEQLRNRGHNVSAMPERPELRSLPDADVFAVAKQERRAVVTENIADFIPLRRRGRSASQAFSGLVLVDRR